MISALRSLAMACILSAPLAATAGSEAAHDPFTGGDAKAGEQTAAACVACHGVGGNSTNPDWPKLAGQGSAYLYAQIKQFKAGERQNALMSAPMQPLGDADMKNLAAYFAAQPASPGVASEDALALAEPLYRAGNAERGIPACMACHGPTGAGNAASSYPRIGGQHAAYTAAQLRAYRDGSRANGSSGAMMSAVAKALSDEEIDALASYLNGLQ